MKKTFQNILVSLLIIQLTGMSQFFTFFESITDSQTAYAQSPSTPIFSVYRDTTGGENISTTAQALSWDTQVSEDAEIPLLAGETNFDLTAGGHYLVMYSVPVQSSGGGNRSEIQSWLQLNGSTDLEYGYASSYIRRANNDFEGYNESAAIIDVAAGDDLSLQIQRTDTNTATVERTANRSGINILKLDDTWDYLRLRPSSAQAITTSFQNIDLGIADEIDAGTFGVSGNDITLKEAGKYLVSYNLAAGTTGADRTNNEARLVLDGTEIEATRSANYIRSQNGSFNGIASYVGIIESSSPNQILQFQVQRESSMQGTTNNTIPGKTGISIVKLPDTADYVRIGEVGGGQDITTGTNTPVTFDTTIEQGTSLQHNDTNTSEIDIINAGHYMFFHSIYNARSDTTNGPRENPYLEWRLSGNVVQYGSSGSYNRLANDGDGISRSSHSSAGIILPSLVGGNTVELTETNEATAATSVYIAGQMGIQGINLSSLFSSQAYLGQTQYRWRDDSVGFNANGGWLAGENTSIANINKNSNLRLRMKVQNSSSLSYNSESQFKLQWAQTSGSCNSLLSWVDMDIADDAWKMSDTQHISPNGISSTTELLTNSSGRTHIQSEGYHAPNGLTQSSSAGTFSANSQKEYEFSLQATEFAFSNASYCFRLYDNSAGDALQINNFPKIQLNSVPVVLDTIWGEAGKIQAPANGGWTTVNFSGNYTTPVIVGRTNTHNDPAEALVFESRNITSSSAEVRLCNSNAGNSSGCQAHGIETIGYVVVDASQTSALDGIEAGTFNADESFDTGPGLITVSYTETFSNTPYVFTAIQSNNGNGPIVTRVSSSSNSSFNAGICEQNSQDGCNPSHGTETVGWIAIDPSANPFYKDMDIGTGNSNASSWIWTNASFIQSFNDVPVAISQTVTNNGGQDVQIDEIQNVNTTGLEFRACELDNDDDCDSHATDTVRWLAIEEGVFAQEYSFDETHYRWYENNNTLTPSVPLEDENVPLSSIPGSNEIRLRMLLKNGDPELPLNTLSLQLQYGAGTSCDTVNSWMNVGNSGGVEDWIHHDNMGVVDGATLPSSLLLGGGHTLQTYNESLPTPTNPNSIPVGEWGEWDFSLFNNTGSNSIAYCFRVVTQNGDEIEYSSYAKIDSTDTINPIISDFSPSAGMLLPIGDFYINYTFSDGESGIDTGSNILALQKWDGSGWGSTNLAGDYISLNTITPTNAGYTASDMPYGRYRAIFQISDNAGNKDTLAHEFFVDAVEFTISSEEVDIGDISNFGSVTTSAEILTITVKTVGASFDVLMSEQSPFQTSGGDEIIDWNGSKGFGFEADPYGTVSAIGSGVSLGSEAQNIHPDGNKYTYTYDIKYSVLLEMLGENAAGNYETLMDFEIALDY